MQVGSALGSTLGQLFRWNTSRVKNLVACGAAAGISAVFNAPIAGVMFSLEVILRDFSARSLGTVVIASVASSIISRIYLGSSPAFVAPVYTLVNSYELFLYVALGILSAVAAILFVLTLCRSEEIFDEWKFPDWLKPAIGGLFIGLMGLYLPQVFGSGLQTIEETLHGEFTIPLLVMLIFGKMMATSICLGSGSSGGVFAPALFIGAVLGAAFGGLLQGHFPFPMAPAGAYALVGMASVFAAAAHAPVTAILIVLEMTNDYRMMLPVMVSVVIATSLSQWIQRESIYTIKLKRTGIDIDSLDEARVLGAIQVRDAMTTHYEVISQEMRAKEVLEKMSKSKEKAFFVFDGKGNVIGEIQPETVRDILFDKEMNFILADDLCTPLQHISFPNEPLSHVAHLMRTEDIRRMAVVDSGNSRKLIGVLELEGVLRAYTDLSMKRADLVSRLENEEATASGTIQLRFTISSGSPVVGKKIRELGIPDGVILTSIKRFGTTVIPEGETPVLARDRVWAVVMPKSEESFRQWLRVNSLNGNPFGL